MFQKCATICGVFRVLSSASSQGWLLMILLRPPSHPNLRRKMTNIRSRAVKSRVRSGCVTCKIRRVKCDERKPVCDRCASAGYECDGYWYNTLARRRPSNPVSTRSTGKNSRVAIPRMLSNPTFTTMPPLQNDNLPRQVALAQSDQSENMARSSGIPLPLRNKEITQRSSSSLSSIGDEVTTVRVQQLPNSSRRQPSAPQTVPQPRQTTSSQEEYAHAIPTTSYQLVVQPSAGPKFKNTIEHQYFAIFLESTAAQLSGYHESSLWDRIVPQACHEEEWAMNAVIAIEALH